MRLFKSSTGATTLGAPVSGELLDLEQVADKVFGTGLIGPGVAFLPDGDLVCSPCDGVLTMVASTRHAFGVTTPAGAEILVHIGMNTVELGGEGLSALAAEGSRVRAGQAVIRLDRAVLAAHGVDLTTPMVVTNSAAYDLRPRRGRGPVALGEPVLVVQKQK